MTNIKRLTIILSLIVLFPTSSLGAGSNQYGAPYDDTTTLKPVSFIFESANVDGKVFAFQGVIANQCQGDGCWFNLKDDTGEVLVDLNPGNFKLPLGLSGKKVKVTGRVDTQNGKFRVNAISVVVFD